MQIQNVIIRNGRSPLSTESTSDAKQPQDKKVSDAVMPETATVANQDSDPSGMDQGFTMVRARERSPKLRGKCIPMLTQVLSYIR